MSKKSESGKSKHVDNEGEAGKSRARRLYLALCALRDKKFDSFSTKNDKKLQLLLDFAHGLSDRDNEDSPLHFNVKSTGIELTQIANLYSSTDTKQTTSQISAALRVSSKRKIVELTEALGQGKQKKEFHVLRGKLENNPSDKDWFDKKWDAKEKDSETADQINKSQLGYSIPISSQSLIGRDGNLKQLDKELKQNNLVIITGKQGIGKTELAIQYFYTKKTKYPGGCCFINARANLSNQISNIYEELQKKRLHNNTAQFTDTKQQAQDLWYQWQEENSEYKLIIIDDVLNIQDIFKYLPNYKLKNKFHILITSFRSQIGNIKIHNLDVLDWQDSVKLLKQQLCNTIEGKKRFETATEGDKRILCEDRLMNSPLFLHLAANYLIKQEDITIRTLSNKLNQQGINHPIVTEGWQGTNTSQTYQHRSPYIMWEMNFNLLSIEAQHFGCLLSILAYSPIPLDLLFTIRTSLTKDDDKVRHYLTELVENNLLGKYQDIYKYLELIHGFFRHKRDELFQNKSSQFNLKEIIKIFVNESVKLSKEIVEEYESLQYLDFDKYCLYMPHIAEVGINNLDLIETDNIIYPLISYLIVFNTANLDINIYLDDSNNVLPAPVKLFESLITRLCELKDNTDLAIKCFDKLFIYHEFQQYLYDTEYLQKLIEKLERLNEQISKWKDSTKAKISFLRLLGHGQYGFPNTSRGNEAIKNLLKAAELAEEERATKDMSKEEKIIWNQLFLLMLDHAFNTIAKTKNEVETGSKKYPNYQIIKKRLDELYGSMEMTFPLNKFPKEQAFPYILRAAHYQCHISNQSLQKLINMIDDYFRNQGEVDDLKQQKVEEEIGNEYNSCLAGFYSAIALRVINIYNAFPQKQLAWLDNDAFSSIEKCGNFTKWLENRTSITNQYKFERYINYSQAIGETGHQYTRIASAHFWYSMFCQKNDIAQPKEIFEKGKIAKKRCLDLWAISLQHKEKQSTLTYFTWTVILEQLHNILKTKIEGNKLIPTGQILKEVEREFVRLKNSYGINDTQMQKVIVFNIKRFYSILKI